LAHGSIPVAFMLLVLKLITAKDDIWFATEPAPTLKQIGVNISCLWRAIPNDKWMKNIFLLGNY